MKQTVLWKISVTTTPEAEDAVTQLLESAFGQPVSSYTDAETGKRWCRSMFRQGQTGLRPGRRNWRLGFDDRQQRAEPRSRPDLAEAHPQRRLGRILETALQAAGDRFRAAAEAELEPASPAERAGGGRARSRVELRHGPAPDDRLLFAATGGAAPLRRSAVCLDIGTGSGILAIAAAKLGYAPVDAFDFDPEAVRIARANARRNGVAASIHVRRQDLTKLPRRSARQYSLVCANLISSLLMAERERILARLRADGVLVVAGILEGEFAQVQRSL